jgi:uncharacterized protein YjbI with pentapeptide repeats
LANREQVELLKKSVEQWNAWRKAKPDMVPDLSGASLDRANLQRADLSGATLSDANLSGAHLRKANLNGANLSRVDLGLANISRARFYQADLSGARLSNTYAFGARLEGANLTGANLIQANLRGAELVGATLCEANLNWANLTDADLDRARLVGSNLNSVTFDLTSLDHTVLTGAHLGNAILTGLDLRRTEGLRSVEHHAPSSLGVDTIYKSGGQIPEAFLRGCGVPEGLIAFTSSISGEAFAFYSCFISYSGKDHDFAERLYVDLQAKGVRCWFAPEDMKIGDKFRLRADESIRLHDKLLLVLSETSVSSQWVEQEVETALAREREGKAVLFPVRIDEAVMKSDTGWPALIKNTRLIGDFQRWKDHDAYQKAFDRLLRDLQADKVQ